MELNFSVDLLRSEPYHIHCLVGGAEDKKVSVGAFLGLPSMEQDGDGRRQGIGLFLLGPTFK